MADHKRHLPHAEKFAISAHASPRYEPILAGGLSYCKRYLTLWKSWAGSRSFVCLSVERKSETDKLFVKHFLHSDYHAFRPQLTTFFSIWIPNFQHVTFSPGRRKDLISMGAKKSDFYRGGEELGRKKRKAAEKCLGRESHSLSAFHNLISIFRITFLGLFRQRSFLGRNAFGQSLFCKS